jgi:hypothetical protein
MDGGVTGIDLDNIMHKQELDDVSRIDCFISVLR